jgi:electron-transferring-flavoprotein dehydrogenase
MNSMRLKGIHLAMRSGMHAAETAFDAIRAGDTSAARLQQFEAKINDGPIRRELYPVRNVHQAFGHGLLAGLTYCVAGQRRHGGGSRRCEPSLATTG